MRYHSLEKLINLHDGYRRVFRIDQHQLLLLQHEGDCYLLEATCPHRGHALEQAAIEFVGGQLLLTCPRHHYRFDIVTGELRQATEAPCRGLRRYDLADRGNELGVML